MQTAGETPAADAPAPQQGLALHWQVFIAILLAVVAGLLTAEGSTWHNQATGVYQFFGTLFLNALKMLIVPLIMSSIASGVIGAGALSFGRLGGKTFAYFMFTSSVAAAIGLTLINLINPGLVGGLPARELLALEQLPPDIAQRFEGRGFHDLLSVFTSMVPPNIVEAAAHGQFIGLIFFALLFGYFVTQLPLERREFMAQAIHSFFDVMLSITHWVMRFAPLGVFALVARVVATTGFEAFIPLAKFLLTVFAGLGIHLFVVLPLLLMFGARVSPWKFFSAMAPVILTAFSTSSSAATLPVTIDCLKRRTRVSRRVSSFVVPMGATINMDGTALFEVVAALFIAQAYGLELSLAQQVSVVLLSIVTSLGVAAVPSASMVAIVLILGTLGIPQEAILLVFAVDRLPDMARTVINVFSDAVGAAVIARSEGETDLLEPREDDLAAAAV